MSHRRRLLHTHVWIHAAAPSRHGLVAFHSWGQLQRSCLLLHLNTFSFAAAAAAAAKYVVGRSYVLYEDERAKQWRIQVITNST